MEPLQLSYKRIVDLFRFHTGCTVKDYITNIQFQQIPLPYQRVIILSGTILYQN